MLKAKSIPHGPEAKEDKPHVDSQVDSGFLSGSNLITSTSSIDPESEERKNEEDIRIAPEPAKASESGLDLGLTDSLSHLSLKENTLNALDSGTIDVVSDKSASIEVKNDGQEPWEIYYSQDDDGDTQLHISIVQGFLEASFFLISTAPHPCLLNILNDDAQTALHLAVLTSQPKVVRRLILAGADPTVRNFKGNTALHLACNSGDLNCTKALTNPITFNERAWLEPSKIVPSLPQNLEQRNYDGEMCIHLATSQGHVEVVRHLLLLGADPDAREGLGGRTALHLAIEKRRLEVAQLLVHEGRPKLDTPTYAGFTAYHLASCVDERLAKDLVRLGATPSMPPDFDGDSDEDDEDSEEDSEAYRSALARLGFSKTAALTA